MKMKKKRFRGQNQIVVIVNEDARAKASDYMDNFNCPIATAIKQKYSGINRVCVGGYELSINDISYKILGRNGHANFVRESVRNGLDLAVICEKKD